MAFFVDALPTIGNKSGIPSNLHMMQHVYRLKTYQLRVKSIFNTDTVLLINQHNFVQCLEGINCMETVVNPNIALLQHYRKELDSKNKKLDSLLKYPDYLIKDTRVWKNLETVIKRTYIALQNIVLS